MWRLIRITVLLFILATVAQQTLMDGADLEWKDNFYVALYPINADGSDTSARYIETLTKEDFTAIEDFFSEEAARYGLGIRQPIVVKLGPVVKRVPPPPPTDGSVLKNVLWSLSFRWFAWDNSPEISIKPDIRLYLLFHDPAIHPRLTHSTALNKGRIGRVNLFGKRSYDKKNMVITAHELLHTLAASDKYDLRTGSPIHPDGFAEPDKSPLYPQRFAELMGAYLPISETENKIPRSLDQTLIGHKTAREIGWVK